MWFCVLNIFIHNIAVCTFLCAYAILLLNQFWSGDLILFRLQKYEKWKT